MRLSISLFDGFKSSSLHTGALKPWLAHFKAFLRVGTEEGEVLSELVELDEKVILGNTGVAWDVMASVYNTGNTETEEHVDRKLNILKLSMVASSCDGTVSLGTEEEGTGKKERSLLAAITTEESLEGSTLLESTVCVVDPSVLQDVTIGGHVGVVHGHAELFFVCSSLVDGRLVHVVPNTVHVVGALEDRGVEEILPVVASAVVEEINPDGFAGTALTFVSLRGRGVSDEKVGNVVVIDMLALLFETFLVHKVILGCTKMRVCGDNEATSGVMDLLIHVHDIILREAFVVVLTVLVVLSVLAIEPEHIDGEAEVREIVVSLDDLVSGVLLPLREVVTKGVHGGHWGVTSELRKFFLKLLGVSLSTKQVEFKSISLRDKGRVGLLAHVSVVEEHKSFS